MQGTKFVHAITILLLLAAISSNSLASVAFVDTKRILAEAPEARRGESQAKVVEKANEVIRKFAEGKNIHFVFQEVVFASPRVDGANSRRGNIGTHVPVFRSSSLNGGSGQSLKTTGKHRSRKAIRSACISSIAALP